MCILGQPDDAELHPEHALHAQRHERYSVCVPASGLPDAGIRPEFPAALLDQAAQVPAAAFLLAFGEELHAAREFATNLPERTNRGETGDDVALIVRRPPSVQPVAAHLRFKGVRLPQFQGVRRLDVIVGVEEQRPVRGAILHAENRGQAVVGNRHDLGPEPRVLENAAHQTGRLVEPELLSGHTGLPYEFGEELHALVCVRLDVVVYVLHGHLPLARTGPRGGRLPDIRVLWLPKCTEDRAA